ncbi:hypothetical protein MB02_08465 [Croceicoccus estronivorus]|uniref:EF-hand domain-containing protein n=1 Tax=Croceicoccus estronivorus TaxID=1172626 RepID=UPI000835EA44|nr:EF-hand domain-containing protein [Croceicoccus estronivorus]OCC23853.1 hypothetical protein MB02_08465 [Croceicoccus estronivorus]
MRTITKILLGAAGAATMAGAGLAYAAPGMGRGDVTRAEAQEQASRMFERMDANKDGKLDKADREARQQQRFERLDTDKNGALSPEEFAANRGKMRGPGDRGPGDMRGPGKGQGDNPDGKRHRMGHKGKMGHGPMMQGMDTNGDGAISQAEFVAGHLAMFDKADADNNGTVTAKERKDMHQKMRDEWRAKRADKAVD